MQDIYVEMWVFSTASKTPSLYSNMISMKKLKVNGHVSDTEQKHNRSKFAAWCTWVDSKGPLLIKSDAV